MMKRYLVAAVLLSAPLAHAAAPKTDQPDRAAEKAVAASQEALRKGDWKAYAALIDPESLKDFRAILEPTLKAAQKKGEEDDLLTFFGGAKDIKTILAWSPEEFFARFMKAMTSKEPMKAIYASTKVTVIGSVHEGADKTHVVVRTSRKYGKAEIKRVEVVSVKKHKNAWLLDLGDEPRGLAESLKAVGGGGVRKDSRTEQVDPDP